MKNLVIFASGNGTNAQRIMEYFRDSLEIRVVLVLSNNPGAYVLERAEKFGIPSRIFDRKEFYETENIRKELEEKETSLIVLAGFLWLIPRYLLNAYNGRIINIHPALLPKYGGKGMYGLRVHEAVLAAGDKESGISIHFVNERYDEGQVLFQARCRVEPSDTPETLAARIHELEYRYYPETIEKLLSGS